MLEKILNFIACGQSGTRIGKILKSKGYKVSFINMDSNDSLNLTEPTFSIQTKRGNSLIIEGTGTGRSIVKGKQFIDKHKELINCFVDAYSDKDKINVLVACLGGGTGSSLVLYLSDYLLNTLKRRVAVISALPVQTKIVSGTLRCRENAYSVLKTLKDFSFSFFFLADNEKLCNKHDVNPLTNGYDAINNDIIESFIGMENIASGKHSTDKFIGSIDANELISVLVSAKAGEFMSAFSEKIPFADLEMIDIMKFIRDKELVAKYDYKKCRSFALSWGLPSGSGNLPKSVKTFMEKFSDHFTALADSGFTGAYENPSLIDKLQINVVSNGLPVPDVVASRIKNLVRDKDRAKAKETAKKEKSNKVFDELLQQNSDKNQSDIDNFSF